MPNSAADAPVASFWPWSVEEPAEVRLRGEQQPLWGMGTGSHKVSWNSAFELTWQCGEGVGYGQPAWALCPLPSDHPRTWQELAGRRERDELLLPGCYLCTSVLCSSLASWLQGKWSIGQM